MTNPTTPFSWQMPTSTDLVTDLPADFEVFGQAVATSMADLLGGTTGQILAKASNTNMDFTWVTTDDANAIQNAIVDAKGDLIAASAADTPARLAVGANGEVLIADSSTATGLRYNPLNALANPIINGGMDIWQRGTSAAITAANTSFFGPDRWALYRGVSGSTYSRQTVSDTTNLPNIQYALRIQRDSGNTSISNINALSNFETANSIPFAGKPITLSFYARRGANYSAASNVLSALLRQGTGTDQNFYNNYDNVTNVNATDVVLTTSWQRFVMTGTVATNTTEMAMQFQINPTGTAGVNDWAEITGVQIDLGTYTAATAPTFRRSGGTIQGELAAASRYYWRVTGQVGSNNAIINGISSSTTNALVPVQNPVVMRVLPTSLDYSGVSITNTTTYTTGASAVTLENGTPFAQRIQVAVTGQTANQPVQLVLANGGYLGFSAEL